MEDTTVALKVLIEAAKMQPHFAPTLWQAAKVLLRFPVPDRGLSRPLHGKEQPVSEEKYGEKTHNNQEFLPLRAEFDYIDENGLVTHRTVWVMAFTDGRNIKRNNKVALADRYGYLVTGYCTLRDQIRSFRSSRISNFRTFTEGEPLEPNRQWWPEAGLARVGA